MPTQTLPAEQSQVTFAAIPAGMPVPGKDIAVAKVPVKSAALSDGDIRLRNLYLSLDPYMRGRMRDPKTKSYAPAYDLGKPLTGGMISEVIESQNDAFPQGAIVTSMSPMEEYSLVTKADVAERRVRVLPNARENQDKVPLSYYLGVLGMPGLTAYVGLKKYGKLQKGETLFVSAAAGAVGQVVGQLAKAWGAKAVGIAGDDDKVKYLKEIGFDHAFNYKTTDLDKALEKHCPEGIDVNFENVGGPILDTVLAHMADHGRIPVCGYITEYNNQEKYGLKNASLILTKRLSLEGFIVGEVMADYAPSFQKEVFSLVAEGKIKYRVDVVPGLESVPETFLKLFKGQNMGKLVIEIAKL